MNPIESLMSLVPPDTMVPVLSAFIFLAVAGLTIAAVSGLSAKRELRQRVMESGTLSAGGAARPSNQLEPVQVARALAEKAAHYVLPSDQSNLKRLRQELVRAGIYDPTAIGLFFLSRLVLAGIFGVIAFFVVPAFFPDRPGSFHWMVLGCAAFAGYYLPNIYLRRRIKKRISEHRDGFPDFLDLLVVCADAGLSTEAAIDRVAHELAAAYPSLSTNLSIAAIEIRAGGAMTTALEHLGDRLGLEEARSFATLLQQSEEYGSSLTDSLRVYSDDMRHARMSRAEEKANSLPSRMTIPLMMFIFPIILVVIMLPVIVRLSQHNLG